MTHLATERGQRICCWPDCYQPPGHQGTELCDHHTHEVGIGWVRDNLDVVREVVNATPLPTLTHRERDDAANRPPLRPPGTPHGDPVVYYVRLAEDVVKIGTTTNLPERLRALRVDRSAVMATEPGTYDLEWRRHQQFAAERYGRREDFALSDELAAHIAGLAAARR